MLYILTAIYNTSGYADPQTPDFAELHSISNFSFLRGASHPEELVQQAHALGYAALALTDECSLAGVVRAHGAGKACGIKLIIGTELTLTDGLRLVLLAVDRDSYGDLSALISTARRRAKKGKYTLTRADLTHILDRCLALMLPNPKHSSLSADAQWLAERAPRRSWIAVELFQGGDDAAWLARLRHLSKNTGLPLVAANDVHMHRRGRRALQDTVTCIRLGTTVRMAGHALYPMASATCAGASIGPDLYS